MAQPTGEMDLENFYIDLLLVAEWFMFSLVLFSILFNTAFFDW